MGSRNTQQEMCEDCFIRVRIILSEKITENFKKPTCANIKKVRAAIVNPLIIFIIKVGSIKMVLVFAGKVMKTAGHVQK
jgi:hypothetical protein